MGDLPVDIIKAVYLLVRAFLLSRLSLTAEILALRQQVLLGYKAAERTAAKYMIRTRKPPSQTWRTFGLRVMVRQPDVRWIPAFFPALFSPVTQFDVCLVGWYNCRMEFLGRARGILGLGLGMEALGKAGLELQAPIRDNLPLE